MAKAWIFSLYLNPAHSDMSVSFGSGFEWLYRASVWKIDYKTLGKSVWWKLLPDLFGCPYFNHLLSFLLFMLFCISEIATLNMH